MEARHSGTMTEKSKVIYHIPNEDSYTTAKAEHVIGKTIGELPLLIINGKLRSSLFITKQESRYQAIRIYYLEGSNEWKGEVVYQGDKSDEENLDRFLGHLAGMYITTFIV